MPNSSNEFKQIISAYERSGGDGSIFKNDQYGALLVSKNQIVFTNNIPGLIIEGEEASTGAKAKITVQKGVHLAKPVHLCFGIVPEQGIQEIDGTFIMEADSSAKFVAHCSFPNAVEVKHVMDGKVFVGKNARMEYSETHFHGDKGGIEVLPVMRIRVDEGGEYISEFKLVKGAVGRMVLDYDAHLEQGGKAELYAKVYGKSTDNIEIKESIYLDGERSSGLAKSRIVVSGHAQSNVIGEIIGRGSHSRGHVDCVEIIQGPSAIAGAVPRLRVENQTSKLTHEAAIGSVDKKQIETLMARGLSEEESTEVIVQGILK